MFTLQVWIPVSVDETECFKQEFTTLAECFQKIRNLITQGIRQQPECWNITDEFGRVLDPEMLANIINVNELAFSAMGYEVR